MTSGKPKYDPYAIGFWPLTENSVLKADNGYKIELYKYVKDMEKSVHKYIKDEQGLKGLSVQKANINIKSKLVSTKTAQDSHLHNLLKWKARTDSKQMTLEQILDQYKYIDIRLLILVCLNRNN